MLGESTEQDEAELSGFLQYNDEYKELYETIFSENEEINWLKAEQAYAAHYTKMQLGKQFD